MGFCTTASLNLSTTAAMANTPPSRSYRLESAICLDTSRRGPLRLPLTHPVNRRSVRLVQRICGSDKPDQTPLRQEPLGTIPVVCPTRVDENHDIGVDAPPRAFRHCGVGL